MNLSELSDQLRRCGVACPPPVDDRLLLSLGSPDRPINVLAWCPDGGMVVQFRTIQLLQVPNRTHRGALLRALAETNYMVKGVKLSLAKNGDEVVAYIDILVGRGRLSEQQIRRCVGMVEHVIGGARARLESIHDTGDDPGLDGAVRTELLGGLLRSLKEAVEGREGPDSSGTSKRGRRRRLSKIDDA